MSDDKTYGFLILDGPDFFTFKMPESQALEHARQVARLLDNEFTSLEQARSAVWQNLADDMKSGRYRQQEYFKQCASNVAWLATSSEEWEEFDDATAFLVVLRPESGSDRVGPDFGRIPEECLEGDPNVRQFAVMSYDSVEAIDKLAELYGSALEEMRQNAAARREAARQISGQKPIFETKWLSHAIPAPDWEEMGNTFKPQVHFTGATNYPKVAAEVNEVLARYGHDVVAIYYYHPLPIMFSLQMQFASKDIARAARDMWVAFDNDLSEDDEDEQSGEPSKAT